MTATSPTLIKTKAETALAAEFERVLPGLPGGAGVQASRRAAMARFNAQGLPHRRIEEWKYTDLRSMVKDVATGKTAANAADGAGKKYDAATFVFVDGKLVGRPAALPNGVTVESLASLLAVDGEALTGAMPAIVDSGAGSIASLNAAFATDGVIIRIAEGAKPEKPIELVFIATGSAVVRNRIVAGAGCEATIIESHVSAEGAARNENAMTDVVIGCDAILHHVSSSLIAAGSVYLSHTLAQLGRNSVYKPFQLSVGEGLARQQFTVAFEGEHASFDFGAATLARGNGHADTNMVIHHIAPNCTSRELFKTVLDGNGRAIFQGKVIVNKEAQKTDGKQMAKALMLSPTAEFDSKPELEIYADDVACGHGSTCAEIDPDLIFYCMSRGIPEAQARALLIDSFVGEAIEKIDNQQVRAAFSEIAMTWLAGHAA